MTKFGELTKEEKRGRFLRVGILLGVFVAIATFYMFIAPLFFPKLVIEYVEDRDILLRAYYNTDDQGLSGKLRGLVYKHSKSGLAKIATKGLSSSDASRRIKSMKLLRHANLDTCYEGLAQIIVNESLSDAERELAVSTMDKLGAFRESERLYMFKHADLFRNDVWGRVMYNQCLLQPCNKQERAILVERLDKLTKDVYGWACRLTPLVYDANERMLEVYAFYAEHQKYPLKYIKPALEKLTDNNVSNARAYFDHNNKNTAYLMVMYYVNSTNPSESQNIEEFIKLLDHVDERVSIYAMDKLMDKHVYARSIIMPFVSNNSVFTHASQRKGGTDYIRNLLSRTKLSSEEESALLKLWINRKNNKLLYGLMQTEKELHRAFILQALESYSSMVEGLAYRKTLMPGSEPYIIDYLKPYSRARSRWGTRDVRILMLAHASMLKGVLRNKAETYLLNSIVDCYYSYSHRKELEKYLAVLKAWYGKRAAKMYLMFQHYKSTDNINTSFFDDVHGLEQARHWLNILKKHQSRSRFGEIEQFRRCLEQKTITGLKP